MAVSTVVGSIISVATLAITVIQNKSSPTGAASATGEKVRRGLSSVAPALTWHTISHLGKEAATEERVMALILMTTILFLGALTFLPIFALLFVRRPAPASQPNPFPSSAAKTEFERRASTHSCADGSSLLERSYQMSALDRCYSVSVEETDKKGWFAFRANRVQEAYESLRRDSWAAEPSNELASRDMAQKLSGPRYEGMIHVVEVFDKPKRTEQLRLMGTNHTAKRVLELGVPALRQRIKERTALLRKERSDSDRD